MYILLCCIPMSLLIYSSVLFIIIIILIILNYILSLNLKIYFFKKNLKETFNKNI